MGLAVCVAVAATPDIGSTAVLKSLVTAIGAIADILEIP
jgi:hypothetical protein